MTQINILTAQVKHGSPLLLLIITFDTFVFLGLRKLESVIA